MNKLSSLILILLLVNNCSLNKKQNFWSKEKSNLEETKGVKTILKKKNKDEKEINPTLEIKLSGQKFNKNYRSNQNDIGELSYKGTLQKIQKYNFSRFDDFEYTDVQPIFNNESIIFFDSTGTVISYDQNQKILWKKNIYTKSEKKNQPKLNFANQDNVLIITDTIAKYYALDINTGDIIWAKSNIVPFNSNIKIEGDFFYVADYKNILRSISIKDGSEIWNLKTEESLKKSNTKLSIVIEKENVYFNNSIGDITAVNIKSGQLVWQLPTQSSSVSKNIFLLSNSKLVINENSILFSNNNNEFYSIDTSTGLINWKNEVNSDLRPVVIGKFIITISKKGFLYILDKKNGNIIRVNDLYKNYKIKKKNKILTTGFFIAQSKIYVSDNDGKLIVVDLKTGNIISINKISSSKILQPYVNNNNIFIIKNGSIIKFN